MADNILMFPTVNRATDAWIDFCNKHGNLIHSAKRNPLCVTLINGSVWYFRGETEGARAYRGYRANMVCMDDFLLDDLLGKEFVPDGKE